MNDKTFNILLLEDNLGDAYLFKNFLVVTNAANFQLTHVETLAEAIKYSQEKSFDVILLDLSLPDSQGIETLLTMEEQASNLPIVVLTGTKDEELGIKAVQQGAQDYLVKGQVTQELLVRSIRYAIERANLMKKLHQKEEHLEKFNQELQQRVEVRTAELNKRNEQLQYFLKLATTDRLTGLANRHYFAEFWEVEWKAAVRNSTPISAIMIDIDYFKSFNDTFGHQKGDDCLKQVAQRIKKTLKRPRDLAVRYGGEEFLVVLPNTNREGAITIAKTIQLEIRSLGISHCKSDVSDRVTVSMGIATVIPQRRAKPEDLIAYADRALYLAKQKGRDRFEIYDKPRDTIA